MNSSMVSWRRVGAVLLGASLAAPLLLTSSGCASGAAPSATTSGKPDMVTDSDEPDSRKRARIRLELAVGYFEQGQIKIALDELKLSLAADPNYGEAFNLRGLIYMRLNDNALAHESFQRAIALNAGDSNALHNYGWLQCQEGQYTQAVQLFSRALANPFYGERAKTFMAQGLCQIRAKQLDEGERSLTRSYELDAGNPITGYNLAKLLFQRGEFVRAQFYVRRLNNSELANAESLWLGVKIERRVGNQDAMLQLAGQLKKRFSESKEAQAYEREAFDE
ncbi:type IV pilus biogenesis/stability protein PilW [Rhodoferax sp.]|uniref:type IV pilus biogenesis/stability protein PilW n=1 Tax=Rhodoferax sp. TaxID=50421 RepID=UPI0027625EE3|nr:type IV pilus biogenesis/stability protein PilW [Rhodoferax sp.]